MRVIDAERNETPKLAEVKHVHRNLVVAWPDGDAGKTAPHHVRNGEPLTVGLWNRFSFTPSGAFDARWELLEDGLSVANGTLDWPAVPPLTKREMKVTLPNVKVKPDAEYFLNVSFHLKSDTLWAKKGHLVAHDQLALGDGGANPPGELHLNDAPVACVKSDATVVTLSGSG